MKNILSKRQTQKYQLMLRLASELIKNYDATIFGGLVRDMLVDDIDLKRINTASLGIPETLQNLPHDIDATFPKNVSEEEVVSMCKALGFEATVVKPEIPGTSGSTEDSEYIHRMQFSLMPKNIDILCSEVIVLHMDVVNAEGRTPPFCKLDFRCNGFIWNTNGIHYSDNSGSAYDGMRVKERKLFEADVIMLLSEKKTEMLIPGVKTSTLIKAGIMAERMCKMWERGWTFTNLRGLERVTGGTIAHCGGCGTPHLGQSDYHIQASCCKSVVFSAPCFSRYVTENITKQRPYHVNCPNSGAVPHQLLTF